MPASDDFLEFLFDQLGPLDPLSARRMFGGTGLYRNGRMFAIVTGEDRLYLKADDATRGRFQSEGCEPFTYTSSGRQVALGYFTVPEAALDDPEEMLEWARLAVEAAERAPERAPRTPRAPRGRKTLPPKTGG